MKWTSQHDVEFCKEVVASKLFETKKGLQKGLKYGKAIAKNLEKWNFLNSRWSTVFVRDNLKKLIKQFRRKENDERRASGISPELTELDTLLEKISEKEKSM